MDSDDDGVRDVDDICPDNPLITHADFSGYETVLLDPLGTAQLDPYWVVMNKVKLMVRSRLNRSPEQKIGSVRY